MIKELVQFTETALADETFRNLGVKPKEGLHIVLKVEKTEEQTLISEKAEYAVYSKKVKELTPLHLKCTDWWKASTMLGTVDTYKVFDVPAKAIHTVSPFCLGVKKTNLEGGDKYAENHAKGKSQVYERINAYFSKAIELLESEEDKIIADAFRIALNDKTQLHRWINESSVFEEIKDGEYVIFYLDLPISKYEAASQKYLKEKLFNTGDYNVTDETDSEIVHGTSNWLNSFPTKKPFLMHQSATFDIAGRITSNEAKLLQEFSDMSRRKLFPNPLPLFVMKDELANAAIKLFKDDAASGDGQRKGYLEIIEELWKDFKQDLGNYYLLFSVAGEIKDFDFVSRFEYNLNPDESPWKVKNSFNIKNGEKKLFTVRDLNNLLPSLFNNAFVYKWFDELEMKNFKSSNTYLMTMKYRKSFYDYIYKSKRGGLNGKIFKEILLAGILEDIRVDEFITNPKYPHPYHSSGYGLKTKLNLLFSLYHQFALPHEKNPILMASKIIELKPQIEAIAIGEADLERDDQFAFAAGQVIARIFMQSATSNRHYKYLEPFFKHVDAVSFKSAIKDFFLKYSHAYYENRFKKVFAQVTAYEWEGDFGNFKEIMPLILSGIVFERNLLLNPKGENEPEIDEQPEPTN